MASTSSDQDTLSKLLQMGTMVEYQNEFEILISRVTGISQSLLTSFYISGLKLELQRGLLRSMPTTLEKAFSLARIAEARYEDERPTIAITKPNNVTARVQVQDLEQTTQGRGDEPNHIMLVTIHHMLYPITVEFQSRYNAIAARNSLQGLNIYEGCCQLDIQFLNLEELQPNQDENICYYYWENCFSILNVDEADNIKPPLSADTCGNNGGHDSETSSLVTPTEEVVDSGYSSTLSSLVEHGSPRVLQPREMIGIGNIHELMDNRGIYNFVQLNAGERMRLQTMVTGRPYQGSEDHRRKPRGNGCRTRVTSKEAEGEKRKRGLISVAKDETTLFLEPQYSPPSILVPVLLLIE
ncbi:polypyrimidine tract-binding protein homolog 3 [Tanacetum coccineum]